MTRDNVAGQFVTDKRWLWPLINLGLFALCIIRDTYRWFNERHHRPASRNTFDRYHRGLTRTSKEEPMSSSQESPRYVKLAVQLGYDYCGRPDLSIPLPLSTFVLPKHPFTILWPFVLVRELILDDEGNAIETKRGRERMRYKLRLLPRR